MLGSLMVEDQINRGRITIEGSPTLLPGEAPYLSPLGWEVTLSSGLMYENIEYLISYPLSPGSSVWAETNEGVFLAGDICARVHSLAMVLESGLIVSAPALPPEHAGRVPLIITNTTNHVMSLTPDMRIAVLVFEPVLGGQSTRETV